MNSPIGTKFTPVRQFCKEFAKNTQRIVHQNDLKDFILKKYFSWTERFSMS